MVTIAVIDAQTKEMITHIQGKLVEKNPSFVIIDCNDRLFLENIIANLFQVVQ